MNKKNMTKELEGLEEDPKAEIHIDLLNATLRKISNWKTPGYDGIHGFCFKKFISIHDIKKTRHEQMITRSVCTRMDGQRKNHMDPKRIKQRNRSKQL